MEDGKTDYFNYGKTLVINIISVIVKNYVYIISGDLYKQYGVSEDDVRENEVY